MTPCLLIAIWKMWNELDSRPWTMAKTPSGSQESGAALTSACAGAAAALPAWAMAAACWE
jgi:hypothetical protein